MSRVQLALNVSDLEKAVDYYGRLFDAEPAKRKPGYANFAIEQPPLKLVLIEKEDGGTINHLGVEVESIDSVRHAETRLLDDGVATTPEQGVCCYAEQDKVWTNDPDGVAWEVYTVLADADSMERSAATACC
ncbi:MAG: VOC family protein [Acidimicrobiia bacterium]|nr:VOC family protein [Acidimicrobiia bacterium]NNC74322.1 glyoxalase/bleomycin resistance/extradiol dioxygenase family protein [Acidimicrobiia bacterium]